MALGSLSALIFFSHVQGLLHLGIATGVLLIHALLARDSTLRRLVACALLTLGPAGVLTLIWVARQAGEIRAAVAPFEQHWLPLSTRIAQMSSLSTWVTTDPRSRFIFVVVGMAAFAAAFVCHVGGRQSPAATPNRRGFVALLVGCIGVFYLIAPTNWGHYWNLHSRSLAFAVVLLPLLLPLRLSALGNLPAKCLAIAILLVPALYARASHTTALAQWNQYTRGFTETLAAAPPQQRLFYWAEKREPTGFHSLLWRHLGQYYTVLNEGMTHRTFADYRSRLIKQLPASTPFDVATRDHLDHLQKYGCFELVLHVGKTPLEKRPNLTLLTRHHHWSLYRTQMQCSKPSPE
jgi:hypothetical protein